MTIITNYTPPAPVNPYAATVQELVNAGPGAAFVLTAPTKAAEGKRGSISTERIKFQNAAREAGYTAKVAESRTESDGTTTLVFILTEKRERNVKPKAADTPVTDKGTPKGE